MYARAAGAPLGSRCLAKPATHARPHSRRVFARAQYQFLTEDNYARTLRDDCKYLGTGSLTFEWSSDRGEDKYLAMCTDVLASPKFANVADVTLRAYHLPLDSRFLGAIARHRPGIRKLDLECWTYYDCTETLALDAEDLRALAALQEVCVNMSDSTAFPKAMERLVEKLPALNRLNLSNRGCGYPEIDARKLPRYRHLHCRNVRITNRLWLKFNGSCYQS
ncbi:hypothetical protein WJX72_009177 [[Myrmecia] bisecta]|uniref:Mitochondrial ATP synthase regulatory component factor B n=1 Tax=[Myrmecia] bisecta TaxID=41462 RepID=A0AAW1PF17_9CHLO